MTYENTTTTDKKLNFNFFQGEMLNINYNQDSTAKIFLRTYRVQSCIIIVLLNSQTHRISAIHMDQLERESFYGNNTDAINKMINFIGKSDLHYTQAIILGGQYDYILPAFIGNTYQYIPRFVNHLRAQGIQKVTIGESLNSACCFPVNAMSLDFTFFISGNSIHVVDEKSSMRITMVELIRDANLNATLESNPEETNRIIIDRNSTWRHANEFLSYNNIQWPKKKN
jgi:hypothetical protein